MKPSRIFLLLLAIVPIGIAAFLAIRSIRGKGDLNASKPNLAYLSLLEENQILAKIGSIELRADDLRDALQMDFHGQLSHASLSPEELALRISRALDKLIEDELLAQEAKKQGLKTDLRGTQARQELAKQYLEGQVAKLPPVSDAEMRSFYKNHGEKFYIPPGVQVRELFLPHQGTKEKEDEDDQAYRLGEKLAARIRKGESLEELAKQSVLPAHRARAQVHLFKGGVMDAADEQQVLNVQPGEVVGPSHVEGGYSIFQGVAPVRSRLIPFYQAQENIKAYLETRRAEETRKQLVSHLREQIPVERFGPNPAVAAVH